MIFFFSEGNTNFLTDYFVHTDNFYYCFFNNSLLLIYDCSSEINSCTHVHEEGNVFISVFLIKIFMVDIYYDAPYNLFFLLLFIFLFDLFNISI